MATYDVDKISYGNDEYNVNRVRQGTSTSGKWRRLLMCVTEDDEANPDSISPVSGGTYTARGLAASPATGTMRANRYNLADKCRLQWNSTDEAVEFVFL